MYTRLARVTVPSLARISRMSISQEGAFRNLSAAKLATSRMASR